VRSTNWPPGEVRVDVEGSVTGGVRAALLTLATALLVGCGPEPSASPPSERPSPTTDPGSDPTAPTDPDQVLEGHAAELRRAVDDAAAAVPAVNRRDLTGDDSVGCYVGLDDDGSQQWSYSLRLLVDGDPAEASAVARARLEAAGFAIRDNAASLSWTAQRDGASINSNAGSDPSIGSGMTLGGVTACVSPEGAVDTTNAR
jgi:hypothetical protein